jgi:formylglycine-generating enzyme required for sulfatase activity
MISQKQETERAIQLVERFVRRFQESYRLLAYHAALPLVLTPELLNFLRVHFLRGQVPWVAEVDLLLSDLCKQVGYEQYAMDTAVRAYLVEEMKHQFGEERMQEVARILVNYVRYMSKNNPYISPQELEMQQWAAMVYLGDEQCQAVAREIAERLIEVSDRGLGESAIRAELGRLAQITQDLSPQLQKQPCLLDYARLVQQVLRTPESVNPGDLYRSYLVEDMELRLPQDLVMTMQSSTDFPSLQNIVIQDEIPTYAGINLQAFEFEVTTVAKKISSGRRNSSELIVNRYSRQNQYFLEDLDGEVALEMVQIPGGGFMMGALETEVGSRGSERPLHEVTMSSFFMSKYPITQAQWQVVANMKHLRVNRDLKLKPSQNKGDCLPVERVSWYDAVEFCARLSKHTVREYRLPSEAEWEYAARAGTTTQFHYGETITRELANYNTSKTFAEEQKGQYRQQSTPVGQFPANNFGLYDMHGNVWEWCVDDWHDSYENAPTDGSARVSDHDNFFQLRVLRGGSWSNPPVDCRCANHHNDFPGNWSSLYGFRVVCLV